MIASLPFTPGHEATGVVEKTGPEATIKVGTKVAVENHFYCGDCYTCYVSGWRTFYHDDYKSNLALTHDKNGQTMITVACIAFWS